MIQNYSAPGTTIQQIISTYDPASEHELSPCVIGNVYELKRYTDLTERKDIVGYSFAFAQLDVPVTPSAGHTVQSGDSALYVENALALIGDALVDSDATASEPTAVVISNDAYSSLTPTLQSDGAWTWGAATTSVPVLPGQQIKIGSDLRTIVAIVPALSAAPAVSPKFASNEAAASDVTVDASGYTGLIDTVVTLTCTAKGSGPATLTFVARDTKNNVVSSPFTVTGSVAGTVTISGVAITVATAAVTANLADYTANTTVIYGVVLKPLRDDETKLAVILDKAPLAADLGAVLDIVVPYEGVIPEVISGTTNWTVITDALRLIAAPYVSVSDNSLALYDYAGLTPVVYPSFKALRTTAVNDGITGVSSSAEIVTAFGKIDAANPLAFAVYKAFIASGGMLTYGIEVTGTDQTAWEAALPILAQSRLPYSLVPLTDSLTIQKLFADHAVEMSNEENQKWRRVYGSTQTPVEQQVISAFGTANNTTTFTISGAFTDPLADAVKRDMVLRITTGVNPDGSPATTDYTILDGSDHTIRTTVAVPTGSYSFEVVAPRLAKFVKDYVIARSLSMGSIRITNVWADTDDLMMYQAAEIAGYRAALPPHKGLTRTEVGYITAAPRMYTQYTKTILNEIAAAGTMIVTQDDKYSPVYIRHQLTTETNEGVASQEESFITNFDLFCLERADIVGKYIGKYNATADTVSMVDLELRDMLNRAATKPVGDWLGLGPRLQYDPQDISVQRNATFRDRIDTKGRIFLPTPLNQYKEVWFGEIL